MRILDYNSDKSLKNVTLYLTLPEAKRLRDSLKGLLKSPFNNHSHVPNEDYNKEVTVCIYDPDNLGDFNERSVNLIKNDA